MIRYDYAKIAKLYFSILQEEQYLSTYFHNIAQKPLEIFYEDYLGNERVYIETVLALCEIPIKKEFFLSDNLKMNYSCIHEYEKKFITDMQTGQI